MNKTELYLGGCLEEMDKLIRQNIQVDAIITDPPFNLVGKIGADKMHMFRQGAKCKDSSMTEEKMSFDTGFSQEAWLDRIPKLLKKDGNIIIFNDWENMGDIAKYLRARGIKVKNLNHWQKTNPQPAEWRRRFVGGREYILHAVKGKIVFNVEKLHKGVFEYPLTPQREKKHGKHPNQKPISLMEEIIGILSNKGQIILDPFMGSGTTGVACKNLDREFIGIEMEEEYFKIAEKRINNVDNSEQEQEKSMK